MFKKGPKAILSSAIANALAEFFEVDADKIQSNLLGHASITLYNVRLKEQISSIPQNSAGNETKIKVTGIVEEVAFSWAWSVGQQKNKAAAAAASDSWVKDAVLTIKGAKFVAELDQGKRSGTTSVSSSNEDTNSNEAFVDPATIDSDAAKAIKKEPGGLTGYVQNQVKMIIDMLTLRIVGFELSIILPVLNPVEGEVGGKSSNSSSSSSTRTLKIGGEELELMSLGRQEKEGITSMLRQKLSINSFFSSVACKDSSEDTSVPFIEPFSYSAEVTRLGGDRFGSFATGLEVVGMQDDSAHDGFVLHAGTVQIETLMQLGVLLLAPPDKADELNVADISMKKTMASANAGIDNPSQGNTSVSSFTFPLASLSLIILEENRIVASELSMTYKADGTVCGGTVNRLQFDSSSGGQAEANGIKVNMRPSIQCTMDSIDSIYIPDSFLLSKPIESTKLLYQGETLSLVVDTIDAVLFNDAVEKETVGDVAETSVASKSTQRPVAPCPMHLSIRNIHLKQSNDGTSMDLSSLNLYASPEGPSRTQVALQFNEFKSHLLQLTMANICATLPPSPDVFESLKFSGETIRVTAGHSTDDWQSQFRSKARRMSSTTRSIAKASKLKPPSSTSPAASMHLPHATISGLNVTITWESGSGVRLKDTTLGIKPFEGNESTTAKDLINYYTKACLSRVPNFVSNAEVLGINLVDSTAVTYGTWLGISSLGAGGGVAAVAGVDAVKGAVAAGKRSRKADESEGWRPGDLLRGVIYSAGEATKEGAIKRGKSHGKGNVIDWALGAADGTAQYADENKSKLGGAAAGGGGFLVGFALGGPIGGIIGGVVANATTRKAIESFEEKSDISEH